MRTAALAGIVERVVGAASLFLIGFAIGSLAMTLWDRFTHCTERLS